MKNTNWKDFAELIGIAAIVGSLIFVGLEMRQAQAIAFSELQNDMIPAHISRNDFIIEHTDLLLKANSGAKLTDSESFILHQIIDALWGSAFFGYQRWSFVGHFAIDEPLHAFSRFLYENPGARQAWSSYLQQRQLLRSGMDLDAIAMPRAIAIVETDLAKLDVVYN